MHLSSFTPESMKQFGQQLVEDARQRAEFFSTMSAQVQEERRNFRGEFQATASERRDQAQQRAEERRTATQNELSRFATEHRNNARKQSENLQQVTRDRRAFINRQRQTFGVEREKIAHEECEARRQANQASMNQWRHARDTAEAQRHENARNYAESRKLFANDLKSDTHALIDRHRLSRLDMANSLQTTSEGFRNRFSSASPTHHESTPLPPARVADPVRPKPSAPTPAPEASPTWVSTRKGKRKKGGDASRSSSSASEKSS